MSVPQQVSNVKFYSCKISVELRLFRDLNFLYINNNQISKHYLIISYVNMWRGGERIFFLLNYHKELSVNPNGNATN